MKKTLSRFWNDWKFIAGKIGDFQIKVIFSFFYYVLITPLGFIATIFKDFMERKSPPRWHKVGGSFENLEELEEQS